MPVTDYHKQIRDAVADTLDGLSLGMPVVRLDDLDQCNGYISLPCVVVAPVGPESAEPSLGTNQHDGIRYSVAVAYLSTGVANGSQSGPQDLTALRREVRVAFNQKRLSGVTEVGWCEVSDLGAIFERDSEAFQRLRTGLVVSACGRFPRS